MANDSKATIVAVDSQILVWGIRKQGDEEQNKQAKWLFQELGESGSQIILPSVALSEYLTKVEEDEQRSVIAKLTTRFIVAPFDVKCASLAAILFAKGKKNRPKGVAGARSFLRADAMIIATAVTHGAKIFYSGDKKCRKLASSLPQLDVKGLSDIPPNLFGYPDESD
ncbi:MAG: PIN domain-containing protein [Planctomycetes bacterium]|nr:PIN domain-containing protein [Planctomycetota bacterium]